MEQKNKGLLRRKKYLEGVEFFTMKDRNAVKKGSYGDETSSKKLKYGSDLFR